MSDRAPMAPAEAEPALAPSIGNGGGSTVKSAPAREHGTARGLLRALRPKQWAKNVLVLAAPGAAGVITQEAGTVVLAFIAFCLVSSATYLLNDVADAEQDRRHPVKRNRPIAAGLVSPRLAVVVAVVLMLAGFGVAFLARAEFAGMVGIYVLVTGSYTVWLKHIAVVDLTAVAAGFVIRAVAGGVAVDVPISRWFLIVTSFGSLFMVAGKRHGEHLHLGPDRARVRATLAAYSSDYLRHVYTLASGVTMTAYCLWAFEQSSNEGTIPWFELSIVPFVMFVLRYALLIEEGHGGAPEDVVLGDRTLLIIGAIWVIVYGVGVIAVH